MVVPPAETVVAPLDFARPSLAAVTESASRAQPGVGVAALTCARGRLIHRVVLHKGRVAAYTIDAPTARRFGPEGDAVGLLAQCQRAGDAVKAFENLLEFGLGDAGAVVAHAHGDVAAIGALRLDIDLGFLARILHGVIDQVGESGSHFFFVALHGDGRSGFVRQGLSRNMIEAPRPRHALLDNASEVDGRDVQRAARREHALAQVGRQARGRVGLRDEVAVVPVAGGTPRILSIGDEAVWWPAGPVVAFRAWDGVRASIVIADARQDAAQPTQSTQQRT